MNQSIRRILFAIMAAILLLVACAPVPVPTQDPAIAQQLIDQSVALTVAAEGAQAKDQQLIEQSVALTVAVQNSQATEHALLAAPTFTTTPETEATQVPATLTPETVPLPGASNQTISTFQDGITPSATPDPNAPIVDKVDPPEGPTRGGTVVTISGKNFALGKDMKFFFGENAATSVVCEAEIKCTAVTPQGLEGIVVVQAQNGALKSQHVPGNVYDGFKYNAPPKYGCSVLMTTPKNLTVYKSGEDFAIKWIVKNTGQSTWPAGLDFKYSGGVNMATISSLEIPKAMKPNDTYSVKLNAAAPKNPGKYYMTWIVEGMGCNGYVAVVVE